MPPEPATVGHRSIWADIRAGIVGEPRDYTAGSIGRAILVLAVPMVLEMSMQSVFAVVDVFFVGKLGSDAVAVVGIADSLLALVFSVAIGLSMGTAAMVARRIGEGDEKAAAHASMQSIWLGLAVSVPIAIVGVVYASDLMRLLGASPELAVYGRGFTAIILGTNATVLLLFLINASFRGAGDPAIAMRALWLANLINIALDPILIFGWGPIPAMGLEGAAVATAVGRGLGVLYQIWRLTNGRGRIHIDWSRARVSLSVMGRLARVSGIGILQYLVSTASFLAMMRILAEFGDRALAAYTIAVRLIIFILLPAWGLGNAAATLVGQNLGAGKPDRAERSVWLTAFANAGFLLAVAVVFVLVPEWLAGLFSPEPPVLEMAAACLRIFSYSYVFWGFGMITVMAFNGAGDTTTPTWIHFLVYWVAQIPLAYWLALVLDHGPEGVFAAIAICQGLLAVVGVAVFRRGTWKRRQI
ncbi:MAG: MATE family efflux transporter [Thermoanaerobaculia bacterium]|nr:MATE family efflux transporter [Thermoanaerobaculia bacterium]